MNLVVKFHVTTPKDAEYLANRKLVETTLKRIGYKRAHNIMTFLCYFTDQNEIEETRMTEKQFNALKVGDEAVFATMRDGRYWMTVRRISNG